jgi:hypothetical protein
MAPGHAVARSKTGRKLRRGFRSNLLDTRGICIFLVGGVDCGSKHAIPPSPIPSESIANTRRKGPARPHTAKQSGTVDQERVGWWQEGNSRPSRSHDRRWSVRAAGVVMCRSSQTP